MMKIRCFVACAFGKADIEILYVEAILKALDQLNIKGLRVDKINHNEKIDKKILELIGQSSFGIADLTYARPSVYFEAGYLEGQNKPVIYLARSDHFNPIAGDTAGNLKVHFDLITKNIISWDTVTNRLVDTIKKRINLVLQPVKQEIAKKNKSLKAKEKFNQLSLLERISKLKSFTIGFIKSSFKSSHFIHSISSEIAITTNFNSNRYYVTFIFKESFTKNDIQYYQPKGEVWNIRWKKPYRNETNMVVYFISLRSIRRSTIDSALATCRQINSDIYTLTLENQKFTYFIVDKIQADFDFKPALIKTLDFL